MKFVCRQATSESPDARLRGALLLTILLAILSLGSVGCRNRSAKTSAEESLAFSKDVVIVQDRFLKDNYDREVHAVFCLSNSSGTFFWYGTQDRQPAWDLDYWEHGKWQALTRRDCANGMGVAQLGPHQSVAFELAFLKFNLPQSVVVHFSTSSNSGYRPIRSLPVVLPK
jgi:hypothetical protein